MKQKFLRGPGAVFLKRAPGRRRQHDVKAGKGAGQNLSSLFALEKKFQKAYNTELEEMMKLKKFRKKLNLNKKTIADLNNNAMKEINGGDVDPKSRLETGCCPTSGLCTGPPNCKIC